MATAVIISGHARSFGLSAVFASQRWHVFRQCPDPYFFCSVVEDEHAASLDQLALAYGPDRVFIEKIPAQPDCARETAGRLGWSEEQLAGASAHAPFALAPHASAQTILRSLWHQQRAFAFFHQCAAALDGIEFDLFLRHRPDLFWHRLEWPDPDRDEICVPYWGGYGGINDRFAIMGREAARYYFTAYEAAPRLLAAGCPLHPETLSGAILDASPVRVRRTLIAEFTGVRPPNAAGHVDTVPMVITEQDHFRHRASLL